MLELLIAIPCSIVAYIYCEVLTQEGHILHFWRKFLDKRIHNEKIFNPIIGCPLCVSGQMAFWTYVFLLIRSHYVYIYPPYYVLISCPFISMIVTICLTILITKLLMKWS